MGKLNAAIAKAGLKAGIEVKKSKSSMVAVAAPSNIRAAAGRLIELSSEIAKLEDELATNKLTIQEFAVERAFEERSCENIIVSGINAKGREVGDLNINFKDQHGTVKDMDALRETLVSHKLNPEDHIKVETNMTIQWDKLSSDEQQAVITMLKKNFGPERVAEVILETEKVKFVGLKDATVRVAKNLNDFKELREVTALHAPTVVQRKEKA